MAKKINILKAGNAIPFADGGLKLSKSISIDKIEEHPVFKKLYSIDEDLLNRIADDMVQNNFDGSQPLHIWHCIDDDGTEHWYLIDGYTRLMAAKMAKLEIVPYFEHNFKNFEEAHRYALHLQVDRRNLGSYDLIKNIELLMGSDYIQNMKGKKSEAIAEVLGVSDRTVEKAIAVSEEADEETLAKVESGELSVNKAYKQTKEKARKSKSDEEEISEALDDSDGNPRAVTVRSRDMSERYNPPKESEIDKRLIERFQEGFVEGFEQAAFFIFSQLKNNIFLEEVEKEITKAGNSFSKLSLIKAEELPEESNEEESADPNLPFDEEELVQEKTTKQKKSSVTDLSSVSSVNENDSDSAFDLF